MHNSRTFSGEVTQPLFRNMGLIGGLRRTQRVPLAACQNRLFPVLDLIYDK